MKPNILLTNKMSPYVVAAAFAFVFGILFNSLFLMTAAGGLFSATLVVATIVSVMHRLRG